MKKILAILIATLTLITMAYMGKQGYLSAKQYEQRTALLSQQMDAGTLAELQLREWASLLTLGLVKNDLKEKMQRLETERQTYNAHARTYALYFAIGALVILLLYFLLSLRGFTIAVSLAALLALINGLITPILMMVIHKQVEHLGDVVLSFESKAILGSIAKLYANGSLVVAGVILLFSVVVPVLKTLSCCLSLPSSRALLRPKSYAFSNIWGNGPCWMSLSWPSCWSTSPEAAPRPAAPRWRSGSTFS